MDTIALLEPVLNDITRSVNFFNGRLLTAEALTAEQQGNRAGRKLLGKALGAGIAYGLEVSESREFSSPQAPVLAVKAGLAINTFGQPLLLADDVSVALCDVGTRVASGAASPFINCLPPDAGPYAAVAGVHLLVMGPADARDGKAAVSGLGNAAASCNTNFNVDAVRFRRIQLDLTEEELSDAKHLRSLVVARCFGIQKQAGLPRDPFGTPPRNPGWMDQLRDNGTLKPCEAPLAIIYWTALGIAFIDLWSVRRRLTRLATSAENALGINDRPVSEAEALLLEFQEHLESLRDDSVTRRFLIASERFQSLPAAGILPTDDPRGFDYLRFFKDQTIRMPVFMESARLPDLFRESLRLGHIDLASGELIRLYRVRQNVQARPPQLFVVFTSGHMRYRGDARYNVNRFNYANYS